MATSMLPRTALVYGHHQLFRERAIMDRGQLDVQLSGEAKTIFDRPDSDPGGDDRIVDGQVLAPSHAHDRILKASRETGGKQLLRVCARPTIAAHLFRRGEVDVDAAIACPPVALAPTRRGGLGGVEDTNGLTRRGAHTDEG